MQLLSMNPECKIKFNRYETQVILGWMIGDALGVTTEFMTRDKTTETIQHYDQFKKGLPGGGLFRFAPGQFSDDTEMGLSLLLSLQEKGQFDAKDVAQKYHEWFLSDPPDMGSTTRNAVAGESYDEMRYLAVSKNSMSLSNGCIMRLTPLIVAQHALCEDLKIGDILEDCTLTHSSPEAQMMQLAYAHILMTAMNSHQPKESYYAAKHLEIHSEWIYKIYQAVEQGVKEFEHKGEMWKWSDVDTKNIGFVGYTLWILLKTLKYVVDHPDHKHSYSSNLLYVVSLGGDTDTNGCCVGAVLAALFPKTIPLCWFKSLAQSCAEKRIHSFPLANYNIWSRLICINDGFSNANKSM